MLRNAPKISTNAPIMFMVANTSKRMLFTISRALPYRTKIQPNKLRTPHFGLDRSIMTHKLSPKLSSNVLTTSFYMLRISPNTRRPHIYTPPVNTSLPRTFKTTPKTMTRSNTRTTLPHTSKTLTNTPITSSPYTLKTPNNTHQSSMSTYSGATIINNQESTRERSDPSPSQQVNKQNIQERSLENAIPMSEMPGPGGLRKIPYIGTLFLFKPFTPFSLETFGQLACHLHDRYGKVFKTRLGKDYSVHTCNVQDIENVFRQEPKYPQRRLMNLSRVYRERNGLPQGLGSCSGKEWYALRKPLNVALKRPKAAGSYVPALDKVADDFIARLLEVKGEDKDEKAEKMFKLFFKYSSEGIGVACFNQRLGFLSHDLDNCPEKKKLLEAFRTSVKCTFREIMGLERRYKKTEKDKFYQTYCEAMNFIRQQSLSCVNKVLDEDKAGEGTGGVVGCPADDSNNLLKTLVRREDLSREQVLAIIDSLLIAGTDSTARILTVLLYDMALNPEIQARVARDVRAFAGPDGAITNDCVEQVRILRACVKESMRVHYPVSSGVERILTHDMVISGYRVPRGTSVFMTGVRTSRDPAHFPNPTHFIPDRWLRADNPRPSKKQPETSILHDTKEGEGTCIGNGTPTTQQTSAQPDSSNSNSSSAFAFIPFGHGVRSCIGSRFAEMELLVGLAKVLQSLEVSVHPSYGPLEVNYTPFISPLRPVPFIFTKR